MLLEDLLKHTKSGHADRTQLAQALKQICEIAENVNESIKEEENFQKLCRIQKSFVGNVKANFFLKKIKKKENPKLN